VDCVKEGLIAHNALKAHTSPAPQSNARTTECTNPTHSISFDSRKDEQDAQINYLSTLSILSTLVKTKRVTSHTITEL
jgi:hypothetical protein